MDQVADQTRIVVAKAATLSSVLHSIKSTTSQPCTMSLGTDGVFVRWEDESKSLQSSLHMEPQAFEEYHAPPIAMTTELGLNLKVLLDTLSIFASSGDSQLHIVYPTAAGDLSLEIRDVREAHPMSLYAKLATREVIPHIDLNEFWSEPCAAFTLQGGSMMKEVIEDLEWAHGAVQLELRLAQGLPPVRLSAAGEGALEVALPPDALLPPGLTLPGGLTTVSHTYKHKHMRAAFCHLPTHRDASLCTEVQVDANGLMKVSHSISTQHGIGSQSSQHSDVFVQFMFHPQADMDA